MDCERCGGRMLGVDEPGLCDDCAVLVAHAQPVAMLARALSRCFAARQHGAIALRRFKRDAEERLAGSVLAIHYAHALERQDAADALLAGDPEFVAWLEGRDAEARDHLIAAHDAQAVA